MNRLIPPRLSQAAALIAAAGDRAHLRFFAFFAANIRKPHTRRVYYRTAEVVESGAKEPSKFR